MNTTGRVGFCIGTGRCGTLFMYQLLEREPDVASSHERNPDNESFHRYCQWHGLPVDHEGFLATKEDEIREDLERRAFSFEASPYLSISVRELHERFGARFVLLVRRPDRVVTSFVHKGFYRQPYRVADESLATGYQRVGAEKVHAFFARIAPRGPFLRQWNAMTQVGRVAWYWQAWNERTLEQLKGLPADSYRIVRIEDLDHTRYLELARFLGYQPRVTPAEFDALSESKPHAFWSKRNIDRWTPQEVSEFEAQVGPLADRFGYEYRIDRLVDEARAEHVAAEAAGRIAAPQPAPRFWRLRRGTSGLLRGLGGRLQAMAEQVDVA
jgi:hypothetical protein